MKPASYQSMASTVMSQHASLALDPVLSSSKVMYCEKCGFASTDAVAFKKHVFEHTGTRFYCFYCNSVFFSEAELNTHLKQHTAKYPFKCPHCGQGYMRRLCLVKHIDRLHSKANTQGPAKPAVTKAPHVSISSASPSVPSADPSSLRPAVRVTVPLPSTASARLGKDEQRVKTVEPHLSNPTNGDATVFSPLNGHVQHNRALTVALPEEVTIPAGCLVELVEVKTVNGTKELKLRLVSQQENESVIKDGRTRVSENTALGKTFSSSLNYPNTAKSTNVGMCTLNRKQYETKTVNVEHPAVMSFSISKNLLNQERKEKCMLKRTSQEIINLESDTVIPNKVPKSIPNPVREGNCSIRVTPREPMVHTVLPPTVISSRVGNRLTNPLHPEHMGARVCQRTVEERKNSLQEYPSVTAPRLTSDIKSSSQDMSVKRGSPKMRPSDNTAMKIKQEVAGSKQQNLISTSMPSVKLSLTAAAQRRPPTVLECRDNFTPKASFPVTSAACKTLTEAPAVKQLLVSTRTNIKTSTRPQDVRLDKRAPDGTSAEPESFPVISSVFSLSQQPGGSIQPLVMALRGIVMDKNDSSNSAASDNIKIIRTEQVKQMPTLSYRAQVDATNSSFTCDPSLTKQTFESVKIEDQNKNVEQTSVVALNSIKVKEENNSTAPTESEKCSQTSVAMPNPSDKKPGSPVVSYADTPKSTDPVQQTSVSEENDSDASSRFLTVSLKRVQVGVWKKSKKSLKSRISKCKTQVSLASLSDCTILHPMPLKVDQLVKRPSPNQPVVVLNHPKPRIPLQGARMNTLTDTGAAGVAPKCQILKMRLSKVMGQKYEVMGCTVRDFS